MKIQFQYLLPLTATLFGLGCAEEAKNASELDTTGMTGDPSAGGGDSQHANDPNAADPNASFTPADPAQRLAERAIVGTPELGARLHSCGKITYSALGQLLSTRGVNVAANGATTAGAIYRNGGAALGTPNYNARVAESSFYSTSAVSKQMDIFAQAASEIVNVAWAPSGCSGVKLFENDQFTKDGISCLIGKPARPEYVQLANQAITQAGDPVVGKQLAISALLSAAHVCE